MRPTRTQLELWALGELPEGERRALEAALEADPALRARADRVRDEVLDAARDLPALPPLDDLGEIPPVPPPANRPFPARWVLPLLALTAAVALAVLGPWGREPGEVRFRGGLDVEVLRVRNGSAEPQGALIQVQAGDRLQYTVIASGAGFVSVFDVQDDGAVALWLGPEPIASLAPVSGAAILDAYPGAERVYFVVADRPIGLEQARHAVASLVHTPLVEADALPLGDGVSQKSVLLVRSP